MQVKFTENSIVIDVKKEEQQNILEVLFIEKILNLLNNGDLAQCRRENLSDGNPSLIIEKAPEETSGLRSAKLQPYPGYKRRRRGGKIL